MKFKTIEEFENFYNIKTYQDYVKNQELDPLFYKKQQTILKLKGIKTGKELYDLMNPNETHTCPFCNKEEQRFNTFFKGYFDTCSDDACMKQNLSKRVTETHKSLSKEERLSINNKISEGVKKSSNKDVYSKEYFFKTIPTLFNFNNDIIVEAFKEFVINNPKNSHQINALADIFFQITEREDLYDFVFQNPQYCSCGKKAKFKNFSDGYDKTCGNRECINKSTKQSKGF